MSNDKQATVVELLQQLGLKEYEAKVFAALVRVPHGTAKDVSDLSDVPRTRVYDAGEQLASRGLVEVQQSNPQQYSAIPIEEAIDILRRQYDDRFDALASTLADLESSGDPPGRSEGVWSLTGSETIVERATRLIDEADEEVVVLFGPETSPRASTFERLRAAVDRGVTVYLGSLAADESERRRIVEQVPGARRADLLEEWLVASDPNPDENVGRLVVTDREKLLLSAFSGDEERIEMAIRSSEFGNGLLILVRRLLEDAFSTDER